jgi:hypothetical protein
VSEFPAVTDGSSSHSARLILAMMLPMSSKVTCLSSGRQSADEIPHPPDPFGSENVSEKRGGADLGSRPLVRAVDGRSGEPNTTSQELP